MRVRKASVVNPALTDALSIILPSPEQTWLLRACLYSGESGRQAWEVYQRLVTDPKKALKNPRLGGKTLAPLLLTALRNNGVVVDSSILPYLRIAYLREELRSNTYRSILGEALSALSCNGVSHIVLEGAALAETVYAYPALRHCDDINILLKEDEVLPATALMSSCGFTPVSKQLGTGVRPFTLIHESGLPLHLHRRLFTSEHYNVPFEDLLARGQIESIAGVSTRILSPADNLLHVCIQAFSYSRRESPRWVADAWHVIVGHHDLDWDVMVDRAMTNHLALPLFVTLRYLAEDLHAPILSTVLHRLGLAASQTDPMRGEATLATALAGGGLSLKSLARVTGGWRPRALVLKWVLFPSPGYLRSAYHVSHSWLLPFYYVYRPLRYVARRIWRRCRDYLQLNALQKHLIPPGVKPGA
jgi:hypothetical protein